MSQEEKGSLRAAMPQTAELVDWLRAEFAQLGLGQDVADNIVLKGKRGKGGFYACERGPDGVVREFGSTRGARRSAMAGGAGLWNLEGGRGA